RVRPQAGAARAVDRGRDEAGDAGEDHEQRPRLAPVEVEQLADEEDEAQADQPRPGDDRAAAVAGHDRSPEPAVPLGPRGRNAVARTTIPRTTRTSGQKRSKSI